jgi:hypothetical protein
MQRDCVAPPTPASATQQSGSVEACKGKERKPVLTAVTAGVHCNFCVNPRTVEAQVQGSVMMALATTLAGHRITLKDGVVEQGNCHEHIPARIGDTPTTIAVHIVPSNDPPKGMGEPGVPPLAPAFAKLTGQRLRELPFIQIGVGVASLRVGSSDRAPRAAIWNPTQRGMRAFIQRFDTLSR